MLINGIRHTKSESHLILKIRKIFKLSFKVLFVLQNNLMNLWVGVVNPQRLFCSKKKILNARINAFLPWPEVYNKMWRSSKLWFLFYYPNWENTNIFSCKLYLKSNKNYIFFYLFLVWRMQLIIIKGRCKFIKVIL